MQSLKDAAKERGHYNPRPGSWDDLIAKANGPSQIEVIDPTVWQGQPIPERDWYVEGMIPCRQVTNLSGDGGSGKTLIALQLIACAALGTDWFGKPVKAGPTLYLGAEDEANELHMRLAAIVQGEGHQLADLKDVRLIPMADRDALLAEPEKSGKMKPTPLFKRLKMEAEKLRPKLIVVDPAADLFGGNEIDRGQVRGFVAMLRALAIELDCAVMMLSHPSLTGLMQRTGSSGSTAWRNSVRSRLYLEVPVYDDKPHPTKRTLIVQKTNYGELGQEFGLRWDSGRYVLCNGDDPHQVALEQKASEKLFLSLLKAITEEGRNVGVATGTTYAPSQMIKHPLAKGTTKTQLVYAMHRLLADKVIKVITEGPPSRPRSRLVMVN